MSAADPSAGAGEALTVSALNRAVAGTLSRAYPPVRVRGEIAAITRAASGHWYFSLKDAAAQVRCVMFRNRNILVDFAPREGDAVLMTARVGLYEARGEFQLGVESLQRDGQGSLFEEFLRRKARLEAEGLFDPARRRQPVAVPQVVGIVTSLQAAALRDVLSVFERRSPYVRLIVYPVPVQGADAAPRIAQMLDLANRRDEVQTLLLVRGGGSIEDLWSFNEDAVVRAIVASRIPVIVGVGHESDFTLADFAADVRAATPTAAAELAADEVDALRAGVQRRVRHVQRGALAQSQQAAQRLDFALRALAGPRAPLRGLQVRTDHLAGRSARALGATRQQARVRLAGAMSALLRARPALPPRALRLQQVRSRMQSAVRSASRVHLARLDAVQRAIGALDPHAVLRRGYSLITDSHERVVTDVAQAPVGARLHVRFARGEADVDVVDTGRASA